MAKLSGHTFEANYSISEENDNVDNRARMLQAYNRELSEVMQNLPGSFSEALKYLMTWRDKTVKALAEVCCLDLKTIQRGRRLFPKSDETV